jgi:hypothetical protein
VLALAPLLIGILGIGTVTLGLPVPAAPVLLAVPEVLVLAVLEKAPDAPVPARPIPTVLPNPLVELVKSMGFLGVVILVYNSTILYYYRIFFMEIVDIFY